MKVTKTAVKVAIATLNFDPSDPKFKFAIESGNLTYIKCRAQELLAEGNIHLAAQYLVIYKILDGTKEEPRTT